MRNCPILILWIGLLGLFVSCAPPANNSGSAGGTGLAPTVNPFFAQPEAFATSLVEENSVDVATPGARPLSIPTAAIPTRDLAASQSTNIHLYTDTLDSNWRVLESPDIAVDFTNTNVVHNGRNAIAMTPSDDFSALYFVVDENAKQEYLRDKVLGLSFWISGGEALIDLEDMAVTVVGSNASPHWVEGDSSVGISTEELPLFSETRLYDLNLNHAIPSNTWVEVQVLLDELLFDPDYTYVTGFYFKNDEGFYQTVYIDDINLMMTD